VNLNGSVAPSPPQESLSPLEAGPRPILPGQTLGVIGGGQLGRMFALAARQMGYRIRVWSDELGPAAACADSALIADYHDLSAGQAFFDSVAAVTFETETLPITLFEQAIGRVPIRPGVEFLRMSQNRILEKTGLQAAGLPVGPFHAVRSLADLQVGLEQLGRPAILKTSQGGYDGKGQIWMDAQTDPQQAWVQLKTAEAILEAHVPFVDEVSVVAARDVFGNCVIYGPIHNTHRHQILDVSYCPAGLSKEVAEQAESIARRLAQAFEVVGVFCVELFVLASGDVWINEIAPRPHNSGHLTIEGHATSQFQQQVRCLSGLSVGSAELLRPVAMANLLGDCWALGEPNWPQLSQSFPSVQWHLYGKEEPRAGRKMGHVTATASSPNEAAEIVRRARQALVS
jgi:5-(carboxyamino)imidazole ribonucleotide synthase